MSIVAKSLKRLKENKKPEANISGSSKSSVSILGFIGILYVLTVIIFVFTALIYVYISSKNIDKRINSSNFPPIAKLKNRLNHEQKLAMSVKMQPKGLDDLFVLKQYDKMFELAKRQKNFKYEGLYFFKKGELNRAYSMFEKYTKHYPNDYEAKTYMAFVLYKKQNFEKALKMLDSIKIKNCNIGFDKAVIYEASGEYEKALKMYRKTYRECKNPIIASRIKKKIIVLEYYLRNKNES